MNHRFSNDFPRDWDPFTSPLTSGITEAELVEALRFPKFARWMFIIGIIGCCVRGVLFLSGCVALTMIERRDPVFRLVVAEVVTGGIIAIGGLLGFGFMLARRPIGRIFAWISLTGVSVSIGVGLMQMPYMPAFRDEGAAFVGAVVGLIATLALRIGLAITIGLAIVQFTRWVRLADVEWPTPHIATFDRR